MDPGCAQGGPPYQTISGGKRPISGEGASGARELALASWIMRDSVDTVFKL